jgi:hypothetical protein
MGESLADKKYSDELINKWKEYLKTDKELPYLDRHKLTEMGATCGLCRKFLNHGHIYNFNGGYLHRHCYITVIDAIKLHDKNWEQE